MRRVAGFTTLLLLGCQQPTQLLVQVDSDLEPGVEIVAVEVNVSAEGGRADNHRFELAEHALPLSFGVAPSGARDEAVRVLVMGIGPEGSPVVRFEAHTSFVPGSVRLLDAPLGRACVGLEPDCETEGQTCRAGACASPAVDGHALPETSRDADPEVLFDGPRVAPDAGPPPGLDATIGPCVPDAPCDTGVLCEIGGMDCDADLPTCTARGLAPAGTACGEGRACDEEGQCGASF